MDSNHRRYKPADLQSAPFGHSGIFPIFFALYPRGLTRCARCSRSGEAFARRPRFSYACGIDFLSFASTLRADGGIRTPDQLITNQLLWPTELHRQSLPIRIAKITEIFESAKFWRKFLQLFKEPDFPPLPRTIPWMRMQNRLQR